MTDIALPQRLDNVIVRRIAGEVFLVPIRGRLADLQELFVLNTVGEWLWERLDGSESVEALADGVCGQFEVSQEDALSDVRAFLEELDEAGLLKASGGAGA
jgi:hypothetical protein